MSQAVFSEGAAPATPASGKLVVYAKADGLFAVKDDAGNEIVLNPKRGSAVLVAGTVVVNEASVTANSLIFLSRTITGGTEGHLSSTINAGVSFTINSSDGADTSTIAWLILEP